MDRNDRQIIDDLFAKLAEAERNAPERDREAEALIRGRLGRQPDAPYYMLQTIAVQQQALEALQERVNELEQRGTGGFLGGLFGSAPAASRPANTHMPAQGAHHSARTSPWERPRQGGFMAGAMQTAVGVAGGVLLGNALAGMLAPDEAVAEEPAPEDEMDFGSEDVL
jgi:hypothetical protein